MTDTKSNEEAPPLAISEDAIEEVISAYSARKLELQIFVDSVVAFLTSHPDLSLNGSSVVHSAKSRLKDESHLREKILRKAKDGKEINKNNIFESVTDLGGVRILHLFQEDFRHIDALIRKKVEEGDWIFNEKPVANTWDPETINFFNNFDLEVRQRPTFYTSVHYLVKPRADSPLCCEIQVRTLFEEIWGEVDHQINYPHATENIALREQLLVLSKISGAGSRLLDSIRRVRDAEQES
ncbi:RelA/SpoT domain-containing protein [Thioclava pacifica]|uniref:RelA/SpoT domain-containing protein n=1 Tax=Thioclava pacifica TaxID=285109 RepID=UPI000A03E60D|nr:RelA/SpoT domain-containing protein [Thioclava pacifica]